MENSWADGFNKFFTKGALVIPIRLTPSIKSHLLSSLEEVLSNSIVTHEDDERHNGLMEFAWWLRGELGVLPKSKLTKTIARESLFFLRETNYYWGDGKIDNDSQQWVFNKINKKYSQSDLSS